jgi:hypothetical protein
VLQFFQSMRTNRHEMRLSCYDTNEWGPAPLLY